MKTTATKAEITAREEGAIQNFRKEFADLCENYGINAIVIGSRKETEKFSDEKDCSMCAGFVTADITSPNLNELKALLESFERAEEEIVSKMKADIPESFLLKWEFLKKNLKRD